jgi:geranylgeranyl diphosphate synthase type II
VNAPDLAPDALRARVEANLAQLFPDAEPAGLYEPIRYVLGGGGKRVRPVALLLASGVFGVDPQRAMPAALAVEVFHNFTLVHDDIMDHAATRRGRDTVHTRWDEPTAILAGDLMMGESYRLLAQIDGVDARDVTRVFGQMVQRLCEGQALDKAFEQRDDVSVDAYRDMIYRKTGALLECALELGGMVGGASDRHREALRTAGYHAGQAFQIQDDLLDLTAQSAGWGKTIGGDLIEAKKTFLLLCALENAPAGSDDAAFFEAIASGNGLPPDQIDEARGRMQRLGVLGAAAAAVRDETDAALDALGALPGGPARDALCALVRQLAGRSA